MNLNKPILVKDMLVGDVVQMRNNLSYAQCTVFNIENNLVHLRRPFCYSKGCAPENEYKLGVEEFTVFRDSKQSDWLLVERLN